ncbi:hypothetical protein E1508_01545 [Pseudomonas moraviensis]|nr:hypothetical protein E1508_01545 [Pseudomonas moraviensis]
MAHRLLERWYCANRCGDRTDVFASRLAPTVERIFKVGASLLAKAVFQTPDFAAIIQTNPLAFARS